MGMTIEKVQNGLITFGNWTNFKKKVEALTSQAFESEQALCEAMEFDFELYKRLIYSSVASWKSSPSKSLFHGLGLNGLTMPKSGDLIFTSHVSQTRFLLMLNEEGMVGKYMLHTVKDENGDKIKVKGEYDLTYPDNHRREEIEKQVNHVLQILYLYFLYCRKQEGKEGFKKPKKIYRGIRVGDILRATVIKEALTEIHQQPYSRERRKEEYDCIVRVLKEKGIQDICENNLVSFTSSQAIAKYFANNSGIIVEIKTNEVEVVTSEVHDARFAERDWVSNKLEKEYIVRVNGKLEISDIIIHDLDYYIAINSPLAVNMFDHNDKSATYCLNGVTINVSFVWMNNTTSAIRYRNMDADSWGLSSKEFKDQYGFSPIISKKNLKEIQNFQIHMK